MSSVSGTGPPLIVTALLDADAKVDPAAAERLHAELAARFDPYDVEVIGLGLWRYLGGPWEPVRTFAFSAG